MSKLNQESNEEKAALIVQQYIVAVKSFNNFTFTSSVLFVLALCNNNEANEEVKKLVVQKVIDLFKKR